MKMLSGSQRFWIAVLVIGGYMAFGAMAAWRPVPDHSAVFVTTVLATMGPLVGWVIKGLFEPLDGIAPAPTIKSELTVKGPATPAPVVPPPPPPAST